MKELLAVIPLLLCGVVAEAPAPYPPSGFRPNGPAFELPQKVSQPQNQQQEYLPPVDPRIPSTQYGFPEEDLSVQGLPTAEQRPIFQASPVNGQQYVGPSFNTDIKNLDDSYRQSQYQNQQDQYREFEKQRQLEAAQSRSRANQTPFQGPRQFATEPPTSTTESTTKTDDFRTTESTTELDLNEGETLNDKTEDKKQKVTVEVTKQNVQEYPGELFLSSLAQLQLQPQFVPFGQIRAPLYFQPIQQESQKQVAGFDAATHFAALPSVLAQQQYLQGIQAQGFVNPAFQQQLVVSGQDPNVGFVAQNPQPFNQYQPAVQVAQNPQYQTAQAFPQDVAVQPQYAQPNSAQTFPQAAAQPQNTQSNSQAKEEDDDEEQQNDQDQPQFVYQQSYQPQEVIYQAPQAQYQPQQAAQYQPQQPALQYQPQQAAQYQPQQPALQYQPQQPVLQYQPQSAVQIQPQQPASQYQPQQQGYQPQVVYQGPAQQVPVNQFQPQEQQNVFLQAPEQYQPQEQQAFLPQAQLVNYQSPLVQQYQNGITSQFQNGLAPQQFSNQPQFPQQINQGQDALQSGLDMNQQGNGVEENDDEESDDSYRNQAPVSVAVATAFGTRTQPRVTTRYGAPLPVPRETANPQPTAEPDNEQENDDSAAVAEANAFAGRRKNAKLRSRRVRPIFTLDRSGHLVLAPQQN